MAQGPEVFLPDDRVLPVQDRLYLKYPRLITTGAEFVTVRHEPPFTGQLPEGRVGTTQSAVVQFLLVSPHPRAEAYRARGIKVGAGLKHVTAGTVYERGWEEAESEYRNGRYVHVDKRDPLEVIYEPLVIKHLQDWLSLKQLIN